MKRNQRKGNITHKPKQPKQPKQPSMEEIRETILKEQGFDINSTRHFEQLFIMQALGDIMVHQGTMSEEEFFRLCT